MKLFKPYEATASSQARRRGRNRAVEALTRPALALAASTLCLGLLAAGAGAGDNALPQQAGVVDLQSMANANLVIDGAIPYDHAGWSVADAGDVNGDRRTDVLVAAPRASNNGRRGSGSVWVVFGRDTGGWLDLARLEADRGGFRIDGAVAYDGAGHAIAGAGDVNGDGLADVIVGAPNAGGGRGAAYVVFGKPSSAPVDLAAPGDAGFPIPGARAFDGAGRSVAGAGDVNRDGRADVIVGAWLAGNGPRFTSGAAYVVFGKPSSAPVELAELGAGGFRIEGASTYDYAGISVAGAGDVNGDGRADVIVGAEGADNNGRYGSGSAYVVFGRASSAGVDLADLGDRGFRIDGDGVWAAAGRAVAGAEDQNGDGLADVLIGAPNSVGHGRSGSGAAYVVFGKRTSEPVDLVVTGAGLFRIGGANVADQAGSAVSGAGDLNGDGRADLVVGAPGASNNGRVGSGSAYVVFSKNSTANVDLAALGNGGYRIDGAQVYYETGRSVAGTGDFNGDGRADLLVGSPEGSHSSDEGAAYLLYGFGAPEVVYEPLSATVGRPIPPHAPKHFRRTGIPTFSVTPPLPVGLDINPTTGEIFGTPAAGRVATTYMVTMDDLAGSVSAPLRLGIRDRTAPAVAVSGRSLQRILHQGGVVVRASCSEACTMRALGRVVVPGRGSVMLKAARTTFGAAGQRTLRLDLAGATRTRLGTLLENGRRGRAVLTVRAIDRFANARTVRRLITVTGT